MQPLSGRNRLNYVDTRMGLLPSEGVLYDPGQVAGRVANSFARRPFRGNSLRQ